MAYLYNNRRYQEYAKAKYLLASHDRQLELVSLTLEKWKEMLNLKSGNADEEKKLSENELVRNSALLEITGAIERSREKFENAQKYPEIALRHASLFETIYLWIYHNINYISFVPNSELKSRMVNLKVMNKDAIARCDLEKHIMERYINKKERKLMILENALHEYEMRAESNPEKLDELRKKRQSNLEHIDKLTKDYDEITKIKSKKFPKCK